MTLRDNTVTEINNYIDYCLMISLLILGYLSSIDE